MTQPNLFDKYTEPRSIPQPTHFPGPAYDEARDKVRLTGAMQRIFDLMCDEAWRTIPSIASLTHTKENTAASLLRQLRKPEHGGHTVNRKHVENGLFVYQLIVREQ